MLKTRVLSALALAPPFLLAAYAGSPWFGFLGALGGALMGWEWARLCHGRFGPSGWVMAVALALVGLLASEAPGAAIGLLAVAAAVIAWLDRTAGTVRAWTLTGLVYLGVTLLSLVWLRAARRLGNPVLAVWPWFGPPTSGAYAAGRTLGGPLLAPAISPRKTWSGLLGGVASAFLAGGVLLFVTGIDAPLWVLVLGPGLAVISQAGDLFESFVKRRFNVKDSSQIIPGHGGVLDRMDGLLAAAPLVALIVALLEGGVTLWQ
ncbi:phosphatidate cytidylyltransferase [Pararhodospirillum photometricum]|uniref:phosphatidate cytidylyltransferase n=1 Tax=Pararhodospirillum photometricum TaxID=1084 RepID=UPI00031B1DD1|nr:phosphatidate cytidylyltransferase [Pararhodospirillum photometricum]